MLLSLRVVWVVCFVFISSASTTTTSKVLVAADLQVESRDGVFVLYDSDETTTVFQDNVPLISDFPVTSLRYNDDDDFGKYGKPLEEQDAKIVVRSDCPSSRLPPIQVDVQPEAIRVSLLLELSTGSIHIDDVSFLDPPSFVARTSYSSRCINTSISEHGITSNTLIGFEEQQDLNADQEDLRKDQSSMNTINSSAASSRSTRTMHMSCLTILTTAVLVIHNLFFLFTPTIITVGTTRRTRRQRHMYGSLTVMALAGGLSLVWAQDANHHNSNIFDKKRASGYVATRPPERPDYGTGVIPFRPEEKGPINTTQTQPQIDTRIGGHNMCKINVEVLHHGCRRSHPLLVKAPMARVIDVVHRNPKQQQQQQQQQQQTNHDNENNKNCVMDYQVQLTFPTDTQQVMKTDNHLDGDKPAVQLPQLEGDQCAVTSTEGRPLVDRDGRVIQASLLKNKNHNNHHNHHNHHSPTDTCSLWSSGTGMDRPSTQTSHHPAATNKNSTTIAIQQQRQAFGHEWTRKALGEHASVSSFAAFTMALMANQAPPNLIQASLTAAQDEVRHAKTAFAIAAHFLSQQKQQPVEPGPMPPSSYVFGRNGTALALSTAQEGCIDETLSALLLAMEVQKLQQQQPQQQQQQHDNSKQEDEWMSRHEREWIQAEMTQIALEEAGHAALAWNTIRWICQQHDKSACKAVQATVLAPQRLQQALTKRLSSSNHHNQDDKAMMEQVWTALYQTLVPLVVSAELPETTQQPEKDGLLWKIPALILAKVAVPSAIHSEEAAASTKR
ncbi:expressed unknown protein [Seminavis robusta]|uniref:Uncharacterized protein n=1 Tax=Seminavis robusta TaxID=568900 RepID=A0A9N8E0C5_9STRA|nr:expressed unknown protein [Seminavis robusta]|eukprot:Sro523_g159780.1 n/a (782) ;mRNA; r:35764-38109